WTNSCHRGITVSASTERRPAQIEVAMRLRKIESEGRSSACIGDYILRHALQRQAGLSHVSRCRFVPRKEPSILARVAIDFLFCSWAQIDHVKTLLAAVVLALSLLAARAQEVTLPPIVVTGTFELRQGPSVTDLFTRH